MFIEYFFSVETILAKKDVYIQNVITHWWNDLCCSNSYFTSNNETTTKQGITYIRNYGVKCEIGVVFHDCARRYRRNLREELSADLVQKSNIDSIYYQSSPR